MNFANLTCKEFIDALASAAPVPGGGGASALLGSLGTALGSMVASLTIGKKKYADVEAEITELNEKSKTLAERFLELIDEDAEGFKGLSQAYSIKAVTEEEKTAKADVLEAESIKACKVPMDIMHTVCDAIDVVEVFAEKGSRLAVSDAACAAIFLKSALEGAALNIYINTKTIRDREIALKLNSEADFMIDTFGPKAYAIYSKVANNLKGE